MSSPNQPKTTCDYLVCGKPATNYCTITTGNEKIVVAQYCLHHAVKIKEWLENAYVGTDRSKNQI